MKIIIRGLRFIWGIVLMIVTVLSIMTLPLILIFLPFFLLGGVNPFDHNNPVDYLADKAASFLEK